MPVGVVHVGIAQDVDAARPVDRPRLDQRILGFAAIGAAIHPQRATDAARNAAQEGQSGNAGLLRRLRDAQIRHRSAGADVETFDRDLVEATAEPYHHARHAAVTHDQI